MMMTEKPKRTRLICSDYPWRKDRVSQIKILSPNRTLVAKAALNREALMALDSNVTLITAAPELYNALADTVDACWDRMPEDLRKQAVSALAKATDTDLAGPDR